MPTTITDLDDFKALDPFFRMPSSYASISAVGITTSERSGHGSYDQGDDEETGYEGERQD